jgi:hypothetical protein
VTFSRVNGAPPASALQCAVAYANGGGAQDAVAVINIFIRSSSSSSASSNKIQLLCNLLPTGSCCILFARAAVTRTAMVAGGWDSYTNATCVPDFSREFWEPEDSAIFDMVRNKLRSFIVLSRKLSPGANVQSQCEDSCSSREHQRFIYHGANRSIPA